MGAEHADRYRIKLGRMLGFHCSVMIVCLTAFIPIVTVAAAESAFGHLPAGRGSPDSNVKSHQVADWMRVRQSSSGSNDLRGIDFSDDSTRTVLLVNGSADDSFSFLFYPEEGFNFSDYEILRLVSNAEVLNNVSDVDMTTALSARAGNVTATLDFHDFPGTTNVTFEVWRKLDGTLYDALSIEYLAAGLGIYRNDPQLGRALLSGTDRFFNISDYKDNLANDGHYELGAIVQFLNGSNSDQPLPPTSALDQASLFGIDGIVAVLMESTGQIDWDAEICKLDMGTWDGSNLTLADGCGMGFAQGPEGGANGDRLHFGYDFEQYRAGHFNTLFEWDRFTEGTEFEDQQYTNYIKTHIGGSPPAIVRLFSPSNEFSVDGGQDLYVEMINANNASISSLTVAGNPNPFPLRNGSYQQFSGPAGNYQSAVFVTAPGSGKHLSWTIQANRENGSVDIVTGLPAKFPIQFIDQSGFLFSYDNSESAILGVTPQYTGEDGGEEMRLEGSFEDFNITNPEHNILFSNSPINRSLIAGGNASEITIQAPSRSSAGISWVYDVQVQTGTDLSNKFSIWYFPRDLQIGAQVFGGSLDETEKHHSFGPCSNVTVAAVETATQLPNMEYSWKLISPDGLDLLQMSNASGIDTSKDVLSFPSDFLPEVGAIYKVALIAGNEEIQAATSVNVKRTLAMTIGVTLLPPANRTKSLPNTDLRVVAKVDIPSCISNETGLVYEWGWEEKDSVAQKAANISREYVHHRLKPAQLNSTDNGDTGIIRLGREFIVPQESLAVGLHHVRLWIYGANSTDSTGEAMYEPKLLPETGELYVQGIALTTAWILPSDLDAVIGDGEHSLTVNGENNVEMSASKSADPDETAAGSSDNLSYLWNCSRSWVDDFSQPTECGESLMPSGSINAVNFTLLASSLTETSLATPDGTELYYLRYTLTVSKQGRSSSSTQELQFNKRSLVVQQAVQAVQAQAVSRLAEKPTLRSSSVKEVSSLSVVQQAVLDMPKIQEGVEYTNARGAKVSPVNLKYWEELIIAPVIPEFMRGSTLWKFELLEPTFQRNTFLVSNRLLTERGYYTLDFAEEYQNKPLGIRAGALDPNTEYVFRIVLVYSSDGLTREGVASLRVKTMESPRLIFPPLAAWTGDPNTQLRASARTSIDSESEFFYQFYLLKNEATSESEEFCLDGCTGASSVKFYVQRVGEYILQARLLAANGKTVLDVSNNTQHITISPANVRQSPGDFEQGMKFDYGFGDDGNVHSRGFYISSAMREAQEAIDAGLSTSGGLSSLSEGGVAAFSDATAVIGLSESKENIFEECSTYGPMFVNKTLSIAKKEQPTTANIRNYLILAGSYARLSCIDQEETLYHLIEIVDKALRRTPQENTLQTGKTRDGMPDMDIVFQAQRFYNFTTTRVLSAALLHGSSRDRLSPNPGAVSNIVLDVYEKWREHVIAISTSDEVCGFERVINTEVPDGRIDTGLVEAHKTSRSDPFGLGRVTVAVKCNSEQGSSLQGVFAKFSWCSSIFGASGTTRLLVSLAEMYDYVYLSGIQGGNMTDSKVLVAVNITTLGAENQLEPATSNAVYAQSAATTSVRLGKSNNTSEKEFAGQGMAAKAVLQHSVEQKATSNKCFKIGIQMHEKAVEELEGHLAQVQAQQAQMAARSVRAAEAGIGSSSVDGEQCNFNVFTMWPLKKYGSNFEEPFQGDAYMRRSDGIETDNSEGSTTNSYVTVDSPHLGLYGAIRSGGCSSGLQGSGGIFELSGTLLSVLGLIVGILMLVLIVTGLTYMLASTLLGGAAGASEDEMNAETFVERDYFGRGTIRLQPANSGELTESDTDFDSEGPQDYLNDSTQPEAPSTGDFVNDGPEEPGQPGAL